MADALFNLIITHLSTVHPSLGVLIRKGKIVGQFEYFIVSVFIKGENQPDVHKFS